MESNNKVPTQGNHIKEIHKFVENRTEALDWYIQELVEEISQSIEQKEALSSVHITLLYQQIDSFHALVDIVKGYMVKEVGV